MGIDILPITIQKVLGDSLRLNASRVESSKDNGRHCNGR